MPNNPLGPRPGGNQSVVQIDTYKAANNVVKSSPGTIYRVSVTKAGTTSPTAGVYDTDSVATVSLTNLIGTIPANYSGANPVDFTWPCLVGITVVPGTGASVAVSFE